MRKLLFLLFAVSSLNVLCNEIQNIQLDMTDGKNKFPVNGVDSNVGRPVLRSVQLSPVEAYVKDGVVTVNFIYPVEGATITVTDLSTGQCVYWDFTENEARVTIDMSDKASAKYELKITTSDWNMSGSFEL